MITQEDITTLLYILDQYEEATGVSYPEIKDRLFKTQRILCAHDKLIELAPEELVVDLLRVLLERSAS